MYESGIIRDMVRLLTTMALLLLLTCSPGLGQVVLKGGVSSGVGRIGIRINTRGIISAVRYNSPAQVAGLEVGDRVVVVNYRPFSLSRLNGSPGEQVTLEIVRSTPIGEWRRKVTLEYVPFTQIDYKTDPNRYNEEHQLIWVTIGPV